ncbi:MAG: Coenzyme F420 hydrogenase/dehydrogenase, beta subunit C-terminal domain [Clostridia bacterium]|nr:Coenzyme F420 hydrogenase/dehydrogenase, beta subunit C-terminal domain [Clostridia bacterium]
MENIYLKTKDKKTCNGCTACSLVCPKHCIEMKEDQEGFIYPVVDEDRCIHCGRCLNLCSNYKKQEIGDSIKPFAIINKDEEVLLQSTSGGTFYALLKSLFKDENAVCYGAAYDKDLVVRHMRAENLKEAMKFMGSKYVRSDVVGVYEGVKKDLKEGKTVLFTATPCETMGLHTYLGKAYDNLITCDIICHSNPSPKVLAKYFKALELQENSNLKKYTFRAKSNGWANPMPIAEFANGKILEENTYQKAFSRVLISRPCCSDCKFTIPQKVADITIGDFWGVDKITDIKDYSKGISIVFANNKKGLEMIHSLENINIIELDENENYLKYNHNKPEKPHRNREDFFEKLDKCKDQDVLKLLNNMSQERLVRRIINKLKGN